MPEIRLICTESDKALSFRQRSDHKTVPEDHAQSALRSRSKTVNSLLLGGSGAGDGWAGASSLPIGLLEPPPPAIGRCRKGYRVGTRHGPGIRGAKMAAEALRVRHPVSCGQVETHGRARGATEALCSRCGRRAPRALGERLGVSPPAVTGAEEQAE